MKYKIYLNGGQLVIKFLQDSRRDISLTTNSCELDAIGLEAFAIYNTNNKRSSEIIVFNYYDFIDVNDNGFNSVKEAFEYLSLIVGVNVYGAIGSGISGGDYARKFLFNKVSLGTLDLINPEKESILITHAGFQTPNSLISTEKYAEITCNDNVRGAYILSDLILNSIEGLPVYHEFTTQSASQKGISFSGAMKIGTGSGATSHTIESGFCIGLNETNQLVFSIFDQGIRTDIQRSDWSDSLDGTGTSKININLGDICTFGIEILKNTYAKFYVNNGSERIILYEVKNENYNLLNTNYRTGSFCIANGISPSSIRIYSLAQYTQNEYKFSNQFSVNSGGKIDANSQGVEYFLCGIKEIGGNSFSLKGVSIKSTTNDDAIIRVRYGGEVDFPNFYEEKSNFYLYNGQSGNPFFPPPSFISLGNLVAEYYINGNDSLLSFPEIQSFSGQRFLSLSVEPLGNGLDVYGSMNINY